MVSNILVFSTFFSEIAFLPSLRADVTFRFFFDKKESKVWDNGEIELGQILTPIKPVKIKKGVLDDYEKLVDMSNIVRRYNKLDNISTVLEIGSDKNLIGVGDIIIPKIQPRMGNIFVNYKHERYVCSSELIEYSCNSDVIYPKLLFYILTHPRFAKCLYYSESGKTHRRVSPAELLHYKIPFINKSIQDKILEIINPIEYQIYNLLSSIEKEDDIINNVFITEFDWDIENFYCHKRLKNYYLDYFQLSNNYDCRFSPKFHRPAGKFVYDDIEKTNSLKIKNFISVPITLGASVSPQDFDSSGDYYYISMATIKNFRVELDESQLLGDDYVKIPKNSKKKVQKGDILMTRSGVAIGKFAVVEEEMNAIHSDFTMKIRLKNINRDFAYYYFRSIYFQYLIEINYKGLQNNNIFPNQIQEFPIPDIPVERQQKIVDKIKFKLKEQDITKCEIEKLRLEIDKIIETHIACNNS